MENGSIDGNNITAGLGGLAFSYLSQFQIMLLVTVTLLTFVFMVWLISRKARLWYWKTDIQIEMLNSIDTHLKNMEEKLSMESIEIIDAGNLQSTPQNNTLDSPTKVQPQDLPQGQPQDLPQGQSRDLPQVQLQDLPQGPPQYLLQELESDEKGQIAIGRSGKVYTKEELEILIRD